MILTSILVVNAAPTLSVNNQMVKLDFGSFLMEIDVEGFKDLMAALLIQAAYRGINLST